MWKPILACLVLSIVYVASLYIWSSPLTRYVSKDLYCLLIFTHRITCLALLGMMNSVRRRRRKALLRKCVFTVHNSDHWLDLGPSTPAEGWVFIVTPITSPFNDCCARMSVEHVQRKSLNYVPTYKVLFGIFNFRNEPATIRKRFFSVFVMSLVSPLFLWYFLDKKYLEKVCMCLLLSFIHFHQAVFLRGQGDF